MSWQSPTIYSPFFDARNRGNIVIKHRDKTEGREEKEGKMHETKNYLERKSRNCVKSRI
jgi:hypothetical protein